MEYFIILIDLDEIYEYVFYVYAISEARVFPPKIYCEDILLF